MMLLEQVLVIIRCDMTPLFVEYKLVFCKYIKFTLYVPNELIITLDIISFSLCVLLGEPGEDGACPLFLLHSKGENAWVTAGSKVFEVRNFLGIVLTKIDRLIL